MDDSSVMPWYCSGVGGGQAYQLEEGFGMARKEARLPIDAKDDQGVRRQMHLDDEVMR